MTEEEMNNRALELYPSAYDGDGGDEEELRKEERRRKQLRGAFVAGMKEIERLPKEVRWVARNRNGFLGAYPRVPSYNPEYGIWECGELSMSLDPRLFPELTEESDPKKAEIIINEV